MNLRPNEIILTVIVIVIFVLYGIALIYNFKTGKPIPDDLSIFVRAAMGAAGVAITKLLLTIGKNRDNGDDSSNSNDQ